ncbi:MAG TPA: hypothetical protein EYP98_02825 [Planctomycetes bacterium]|nr:hypothetical protein [Planctomycetota bacterium]
MHLKALRKACLADRVADFKLGRLPGQSVDFIIVEPGVSAYGNGQVEDFEQLAAADQFYIIRGMTNAGDSHLGTTAVAHAGDAQGHMNPATALKTVQDG